MSFYNLNTAVWIERFINYTEAKKKKTMKKEVV